MTALFSRYFSMSNHILAVVSDISFFKWIWQTHSSAIKLTQMNDPGNIVDPLHEPPIIFGTKKSFKLFNCTWEDKTVSLLWRHRRLATQFPFLNERQNLRTGLGPRWGLGPWGPNIFFGFLGTGCRSTQTEDPNPVSAYTLIKRKTIFRVRTQITVGKVNLIGVRRR